MANNSSIEWTEATWNPVTGCTRASPGCDNCYAVTMTRRLAAMGQGKYKGLVNPGKGHFNGVVKTHNAALDVPLRRKKPTVYFVNSMSDLFHKDVPFSFVDKVFAVMALSPQHTFQVLTKRPERMAEYVTGQGGIYNVEGRIQAGMFAHASEFPAWAWPPPNVWLGTSVEDQERADERIPHLLRCPAAIRFLSCEPLLGPVTVFDVNRSHGVVASGLWPWDLIHWVIAGGEFGARFRPVHADWIRSLRDQCIATGVPFFFKQWGGRNKKKAGRVLDGRTWDEMPVVLPQVNQNARGAS